MRRLIFDFFGVLCPDVAPLVLSRYMNVEKVQDCLDSIVKPAAAGFISEDDMFKQLGVAAGVAPAQLKTVFMHYAKISPFMSVLLEELRENHRLGLMANASAPMVRKILADSGLDQQFDSILVSAEEHMTKPHPAFFRMMMKEMDATPADCITIDACPAHVEGAREVGISGILFENIEGLRTDLAKRFGITVTGPRPYRAVVSTVYSYEE